MTRRIAMIGAGIVAEMYAKAFERGVEDAAFAGVFDPDAGRAETCARRLQGRRYSSRDELLKDAGVDAVLVLSPNHQHFEDARMCLAAGKHVLVEKPVAETAGELHALEALAQSTGRLCMPGHNYIYADPVIRMRRLIAEGRFGEIASIWILYNVFHSEEMARRYGGVLREVAVHHAYSLLFLAGRPTSVSAQSARVHYRELEAEDQVSLVCRMPGGAIANLWVSFAASDRTADPWTVLYKILGAKGGASFSWNDALVDDDGGPAWGVINYVESFHAELSHFVGATAGKRQPLSTLSDARDALAIIEAAERSIAKDGVAETIRY